MSASELAWRITDRARQQAWRRRQVRAATPPDAVTPEGTVATVPRAGPAPLPPGTATAVPAQAGHALQEAADRLLKGEWDFFGVPRPDIASPDWFLDPTSGRRAPADRYAFDINQRSDDETGNVKQVWELSRHHHLTMLAAAWYLTGDDRYAEAVARQLNSWWRENPFLSGVNWTSGIELGIRLIAWTWTRRLLDGWPGVRALFEENQVAVRQLRWHQEYLSAFRSRGSSANNHVIAEAAGQLTASCAFPWFPESGQWRENAAHVLETELERNTFASGVNRELASDYHALVAELVLVASAEAHASGYPLGAATSIRLCRMLDAAAAMVDETLRPPRQGDSDDGRALLIDAPGRAHWLTVLAAGAGRFGALSWWPPGVEAGVGSTLLAALSGGRHPPIPDRPERRPSRFADAGITVLRAGAHPEIWCRCDAGPHGYPAMAAHGHADALAIEVRHGGVDVLADPGTYCYHGEARWRAYFRSTLGHNTMELCGRDQSDSGGPFLWVRTAATTELDVEADSWSAEHDGYAGLEPPAVHRRTVRLDQGTRRLTIIDRVECAIRPPCRLGFHLGPEIHATLEGRSARLAWPAGTGSMRLPPNLDWTIHRGETGPILGWYSPGLGRKEPAVTLLGVGTIGSVDGDVVTTIDFEP